jgi:phosphate transport system protein
MKGAKDKFGGTIRFRELMKKLSDNLSTLSNLVIDMIDDGQKALIEDDEKLFRKLEKKLDYVHELCYDIEDYVYSTLALHQPFAGDLRYILSSLKITNEIHRSAHDAVHIARSSDFITLEQHTGIIHQIDSLTKKAKRMFKESVVAFQNRKALDLNTWQELDDEVDNLHSEIINKISDLIEKNPGWSRAGMSLILATRYIERIADHACNIVEEGVFVKTSQRVKIE